MYSQQNNSYFPPSYGHQHQQPWAVYPSFPPPASQFPPYQSQGCPEQMQTNVPPVSPGTFTGSFDWQSFTQQQRPQPSPRQHRQNSVQKRWEDYLSSEECPESLQADQNYVAEVTHELEQRAQTESRLEQLHTPTDHETAAAAERDRRLKWAQQMIISNPALCAEVYWGMTKRAGSPSAASQRSNSSFSTTSSTSSGSPGSNGFGFNPSAGPANGGRGWMA
ncbi:hypothetical protein K490DRAFT_54206 [Saccharata proteae CBS 121410]|uniref:Uncharacterized protein n=1 Tax=Saccharata proteae CBS 121410 TaxID=1314787 RepID=A0A9P4M2X7_9PEZI|nr:hypothetical protein K490DRAFT_54206 [Saccharata proteae CBS 121410]